MTSELLELARETGSSEDARWEFAQHPKIRSIIQHHVSNLASTHQDREDLCQEAMVAVVQVLAENHLDFRTEPETLAYWRKRIQSIVGAGLRYSGWHVFRDGWVLRRTFPGGDDVLGDRDESDDPATSALYSAAITGSRLAGIKKSLSENREQENQKEQARLLEAARTFLFCYACRQSAEVFWYRVQGAPWKEIPALVGIPGGPKGVEKVKSLFFKFVADAKEYFVERGEVVTVTVLGLHVDEMEIHGVLLRGQEVLATWSAEYGGAYEFDEIEQGLRHLLNRGANFVAANELAPCDLAVFVKATCARRRMDYEEFDLDLLTRGLSRKSLIRLENRMTSGLRQAWIVARAKAIECELKMERL